MLKFVLSILLGIAAAYVYEYIAMFIGNKFLNRSELVINGYKLHHSLYGILSIAIYFLNKNTFFLGFGIGIILQHTLTDGFYFIQKTY